MKTTDNKTNIAWKRFEQRTLPAISSICDAIERDASILKNAFVLDQICNALKTTAAAQSAFRKMPKRLVTQFLALLNRLEAARTRLLTELLLTAEVTHDAPAPAEAP